MEQYWTKSKVVQRTVQSFHEKLATQQTDSTAVSLFEKMLGPLKAFLGKGMCQRVEYTGSVYEHVNISGDTLEFDVMFVLTDHKLTLAEKSIEGYRHIRQQTGHPIADQTNEYLDPTEYAQYFFGLIARFFNTHPAGRVQGSKIIQRHHGVACQIDITKDAEIWFQIDLVPSIEIDNVLYVPKPPSFSPLLWRISHSLEEKKHVQNLDGENECRKQVIRITKALFKLKMDGLFKEFTSYFIKTVAFKLKGNSPGISWYDGNLGECVIYFLKEIKKCLAARRLMHQFERNINLLQNVHPRMCAQMEQTLENILKNESNFLCKFSV